MAARTLLAFGAMLFAALPAFAQPIAAGIGARMVEGFVRPGLAAFEDAAAGLSGSLDALCAEPEQERLDDARRAFAATVETFGRVSVLRFGPLAAENRFERLFFWPDARGVTLRQVEALLAEQSGEAISAAGLSGMSVAVQGLPALEFVLHGTGSESLADQGGADRCRYGQAIAGNVASLAATVVEGWTLGTEFARSFVEPGPERDPYRSGREVAGELVKALGTALQFVRDAELLPALGETVERARGRRAPFWRSDLTFTFIEAQLEGVNALLASAGLDASLTGVAGSNLDTIAFDVEQAGEAVGDVTTAAETAFADPADRERLRYVTVALASAQRNVNERLSADLGLTMGFNALDGD